MTSFCSPPARADHSPSPENLRDEDTVLADEAVALAEELLRAALAGMQPKEKAQALKMAGLIGDPAAKSLSMAMTDRLIRSSDAVRSARGWRAVLRRFGIPRGFGIVDRLMLRMGAAASRIFPGIVINAVRRRLRKDSSGVILAAEEAPLREYLASRQTAGMRTNVNQLGEAVLGEGEAGNRLEAVLRLLARDDVDYVSVKLSAIFSQIHPVAFAATLAGAKERLRVLYRAALTGGKFVNLDMEEYRDLALTTAAFREVLDEPEFQAVRAGIVLQAYLPDSFAALRELTAWACTRAANGGAPVKVRLVKGANLAMEHVEAELHGWNAAPYSTKADTDANFRRMMEFACRPDHAGALRVGVASHNLFDVALALVLSRHRGLGDAVEIEMLEGMANHQARAVRDAAGSVLLYAPIVQERDFGAALAYLIRRLDENTAPGNFLSGLFAFTPGSEAWQQEAERFREGWKRRHVVSYVSRRASLPPRSGDGFVNEPDTDFTQPINREALHRHTIDIYTHLTALQAREGRQKLAGGVSHRTDPGSGLSPGRGETPGIVADAVAAPAGAGEMVNTDSGGLRHRLMSDGPPALPVAVNAGEVSEFLNRSTASQPGWESLRDTARAAILKKCGEVIAAHRFKIIGLLREEGKKAALDADAEVSEAVDFAYYYAETGAMPADVNAKALGTVVITPPWNFPFAIPCGGALAALMAGNAVILKPAPETPRLGWLLARLLWEAGVPRDVLQFLACDDGDTGRALITDPRTSAVVLTGGYDTARLFQSWRPALPLFAETSGKNSLIVSALADRDLAVKDLARSAFGHAGQKCSAASLLILEAEVYDDPDFRRQLRDAAASLYVGAATDDASIVTPLIREPGETLRRALTTLDDGEEWLLEPRQSESDPCLWSPGIKLGVRPGSWFHQKECFGPVLGLMRARDLTEAMQLQNATPYGLTAGIHTLNEEEISLWRETAQAGNLYINRAITGAIVQRQPFGGWRRSCIGPGSKAGGPNYVNLFRHFEDVPPLDATRAAENYRTAWHGHFSQSHDPAALKCESNIFRYRPCRGVVLRLAAADDAIEPAVRAAAEICGVPLTLSRASDECDTDFAARLPQLAAGAEFLRTIATPSDEVLRAAYAAGLNWINAPVSAHGRLELTRWLREQAVSETRHRYGNRISTA